MISRVSLAFSVVVLAACASAPEKSSGPAAAASRWETKMRVKDVAKNKTNTLSVDVVGGRAGPMRLEATALLGYPVASYVMTAHEFRCAVYPRKTYYSGPVSDGALKPLGLPVSPVVLRQIALDLPLTGWTCAKGPAGEVQACETAGLSAKWTRAEGRRTVRLEGRGIEIDWVFTGPPTDVQIKEKTFDLSPPEGFRVIRL